MSFLGCDVYGCNYFLPVDDDIEARKAQHVQWHKRIKGRNNIVGNVTFYEVHEEGKFYPDCQCDVCSDTHYENVAGDLSR